MSVRSVLQKAKVLRRRLKNRLPNPRVRRLLLEQLEGRLLLTAVSWNSPVDGFWDVATNWLPPQVPGSGDDVTIDLPALNPTVTIRDARTVNSIVSRESLIVSSAGSFQINAAPPSSAASQIEASTLTLQGGSLTASGPVSITSNSF